MSASASSSAASAIRTLNLNAWARKTRRHSSVHALHSAVSWSKHGTEDKTFTEFTAKFQGLREDRELELLGI